jgi:hypothetical protein
MDLQLQEITQLEKVKFILLNNLTLPIKVHLIKGSLTEEELLILKMGDTMQVTLSMVKLMDEEFISTRMDLFTKAILLILISVVQELLYMLIVE